MRPEARVGSPFRSRRTAKPRTSARMSAPIATLIGPPRGSPPAATSGPGSTMLHKVASQPPSGARVSRNPVGSSRGTVTSQSVPEGVRTTGALSTSPLTRCSTSSVRKRCGAPFRSPTRSETTRATTAASASSSRSSTVASRHTHAAASPASTSVARTMAAKRLRPRSAVHRPGRRRSRSPRARDHRPPGAARAPSSPRSCRPTRRSDGRARPRRR